MTRITINPVFDMETMQLVSHDGQYEVEHVPLRFDREAVSTAKTAGKTAQGQANQSGADASADRSAIIPGLTRDANNPVGLTANQRNQFQVGASEAAGGVNAGLTGAANLATARTRNAGGFSNALAEAARQKMRTQATATQGVNMLDTQLANQKQQQARQALQGLYGTDTSNMLKSMGLQNEDLNTQLAAGRQGWLQNTEGVLDTISNMGKAAGGMGVGVGAGQRFA